MRASVTGRAGLRGRPPLSTPRLKAAQPHTPPHTNTTPSSLPPTPPPTHPWRAPRYTKPARWSRSWLVNWGLVYFTGLLGVLGVAGGLYEMVRGWRTYKLGF